MFDTLKLYVKKEISIEAVVNALGGFKYKRVDAVFEEGDFSLRGDVLEIFPVNFNFPLRVEWAYEAIDKIYSYDKLIHKKILDYEFLILIPYFKKSRRYKNEDFPLDAVLRIKKGDYVVHVRYGIGKFLGVKKLDVLNRQDYYFAVAYDNDDIIYVSKEEAHLIQKYMNFSHKPPKLSKLGNKEWVRTKERVTQRIKEFAIELLKMDAQRKLIGGFRFLPDSKWQKQFEELFDFEETPDQIKAVNDVKADMESAECMDRVICGDVGYGKTEVAMRAAFKAVISGKQVAFLVPTTILAYQHYKNFFKRLESFPIRVEMLSRFRTRTQQMKIIEELKQGKIDIIIGTHRVVSDDVSFKDLGLLIIDEEQRFGVYHKEKIKEMKVGIDVLVLSATPIPRTLYMGLIGIRGISIIKTPPKNRRAVKTKLLKYSPAILKETILKEIDRGGQVFIIHNRIHSLDKIFRTLKKVLPNKIRVGVVHGRLPSHTMEKVMLDFIDKKIDCLLATAIIESGIDIPSANTIIINDAHMFGLSDLHQLRGRVGRFQNQAYAYLLVPGLSRISSEAGKRLELLEEFSHLGAGFEVAMTDLEMRGAGNILGKEQHGFVWLVGFDLYCRLLKKEIDYLKNTFKIESNS
ncbi:MAG: helicase-related protein [Candidatus Omnitrophica bacterium]|nr:helicase-related protein [Candidatus Omnitrophota bacterium]